MFTGINDLSLCCQELSLVQHTLSELAHLLVSNFSEEWAENQGSMLLPFLVCFLWKASIKSLTAPECIYTLASQGLPLSASKLVSSKHCDSRSLILAVYAFNANFNLLYGCCPCRYTGIFLEAGIAGAFTTVWFAQLIPVSALKFLCCFF